LAGLFLDVIVEVICVLNEIHVTNKAIRNQANCIRGVVCVLCCICLIITALFDIPEISGWVMLGLMVAGSNASTVAWIGNGKTPTPKACISSAFCFILVIYYWNKSEMNVHYVMVQSCANLATVSLFTLCHDLWEIQRRQRVLQWWHFWSFVAAAFEVWCIRSHDELPSWTVAYVCSLLGTLTTDSLEDMLELDISELMATNRKLRNDFATESEEIRLNERKAAEETMQFSIDNLRHQTQQLVAEKAQLATENRAVTTRLNTAERNLQSTRELLETASQKNVEISAEIAHYKSQIADMSSVLETTVAERQDNNNIRREYETQVQRLNESLRALEGPRDPDGPKKRKTRN